MYLMIEHYDSADSLDAVIGLIVTGGFFGMVASLVTLANLCFDRLGRTKIILSAAGGAAAILAGIFLMVGVIYFSTEVDPHIDYIPVGHKKYRKFLVWAGGSSCWYDDYWWCPQWF
ncbi:hypothetical protein RRG08_031994 [Elysia crispata]|uniref:Uncharacterized protein n=1 Tax=Elysia crispata TaxID=231223 RepID=A0AAE1AT92_9GAST|nr:hypothetical protein RRG08_031994 [Elysia crispata]